MMRNRFSSWFYFVFPKSCFIQQPNSLLFTISMRVQNFFFFLEQTLSIIPHTNKQRWSSRVTAFFFTDWHWWMRTVTVTEASLSKISTLSTLSFSVNSLPWPDPCDGRESPEGILRNGISKAFPIERQGSIRFSHVQKRYELKQNLILTFK